MPEPTAPAAATPAAPASSSPAAPSTPATPSAPATPATPSTPATTSVPEVAPGQSPRDYLKQAMEAGGPIEDKKDETEVSAPADETKTPVEETKPAVSETQTPEEKAAADAKAAEDKAAADAKTAAEPNPLDKIGPLPAEKLDAALADPEFAAAMEAKGFTPDQLLQTARDAALASQFIDAVGTPEAAKIANESAGHFYDIEEGFTAIHTIQDFDKFMSDVMLPLSVEYGPDGQPVKLADGRMKTDGTVERFFNYATEYNDQIEGQLIAKALQADPDSDDAKDLQAAARILTTWRKNGYKLGAVPPGELTPQQKQREQELTAREQRLAESDTKAKTEAEQKFETRVSEDTFKNLEPLISGTLKQTALSDKLKSKAAEDIYSGLAQAFATDRNFKQLARQARAHGMSEDRLKEIVAMNTKELKAKFRAVASKVLAEYGAEAVAQNQRDRDKTDAQLSADRSNPKVGVTAGRTSKGKLTSEQIEQQAEQEVMAANNGKRPADFQSQYLRKIMELEAKQHPLSVA